MQRPVRRLLAAGPGAGPETARTRVFGTRPEGCQVLDAWSAACV